MGERYVIKDRWIFDTKSNKNIHSIDCYEEKNVLDIMNGQNERIAELEEQLHDIPKKIVGEIREQLKDMDFLANDTEYGERFSCYSKYKVLDILLKVEKDQVKG